MSKMSEMEATIRELRDIASSINDIANWLTGAFSGTEEAAPAPEPEKALTLEEVRAILAEKSREARLPRLTRICGEHFLVRCILRHAHVLHVRIQPRHAARRGK